VELFAGCAVDDCGFAAEDFASAELVASGVVLEVGAAAEEIPWVDELMGCAAEEAFAELFVVCTAEDMRSVELLVGCVTEEAG